jgi:hypothetical protein
MDQSKCKHSLCDTDLLHFHGHDRCIIEEIDLEMKIVLNVDTDIILPAAT